jgi:hypothetical protein
MAWGGQRAPPAIGVLVTILLALMLLPAVSSTETRGEIDPQWGERSKVHLVGLSFDRASGAAELGLRYLHSHEEAERDTAMTFGYGVEGRVIGDSFGDPEVLMTGVIARASGFLRFLPLSLEAGLAMARPEAPRALGHAGVFVGGSYFDVGYSYQQPLGGNRPSWLAAHHFSVRLAVPLWRYGLERGGE